MGHECSVIISFLVEPVFDSSDGLSDVVGISFELWVVRDILIVGIRLIDEMPRGLPVSTVIFDIVGESDAFGESVLVFSDWETVVLKDGKHCFDLGDDFWVSLLKNFLSNSGCHEMSWSTPGGYGG